MNSLEIQVDADVLIDRTLHEAERILLNNKVYFGNHKKSIESLNVVNRDGQYLSRDRDVNETRLNVHITKGLISMIEFIG